MRGKIKLTLMHFRYEAKIELEVLGREGRCQ
jgi:hypothetical protein